MLEVLEDVIGINRKGLICHPYKFKMGSKKGQYVYTFDPEDRIFHDASEADLRALIENGQFNDSGGIFMVPVGSRNIDRRSVLSVLRYRGELLPVPSIPVLANSSSCRDCFSVMTISGRDMLANLADSSTDTDAKLMMNVDTISCHSSKPWRSPRT